MNDRLTIFGFGYSAEAIASAAASEFDAICGTTRSDSRVAEIRRSGLEAEIFDGLEITEDLRRKLADTTHLVISIAPGDTDPVLTAMQHDLKQWCPNLRWVGYLSTVGVYGNHDGEWVDEETTPKPVSKRSIQRINAETAWCEATGKADVPFAIFRLSGIYGPGRNAFVTIENGRSRRLVKEGQVFNRIHREDIGRAVTLAIRKDSAGTYNVTDDMPAPPQDVVTFAHELMGREPPAEIDFETAELTPMARSFYGENKRVSNKKSKAELGLVYRWPDYRTALKRMWQEDLWRKTSD